MDEKLQETINETSDDKQKTNAENARVLKKQEEDFSVLRASFEKFKKDSGAEIEGLKKESEGWKEKKELADKELAEEKKVSAKIGEDKQDALTNLEEIWKGR